MSEVGGANGPKKGRGLYLPTGYRLDETTNPDATVLVREDGSVVARFSAGTDRQRMEGAAWDDSQARRPDRS